jgi:hypothetical protein
MPVPRLGRRVPVDYVVVRETTLDGTEGSDGFESTPQPTTIDDVLRSNTNLRRQLQPTPAPTSMSPDYDSDSDDDDDNDVSATTPVSIMESRYTWMLIWTGFGDDDHVCFSGNRDTGSGTCGQRQRPHRDSGSCNLSQAISTSRNSTNL